MPNPIYSIAPKNLQLIGIFILLDLTVLLTGIKSEPLPEYQSLDKFNGQVVYAFEGSAGATTGPRNKFMVYKINNSKYNFYLGLSDFLEDTSDTYLNVKNSIGLGDIISAKAYFMKDKLTKDGGGYHITELNRNGTTLVTYETMEKAIEKENLFNFMLFLGLNLACILGFIILISTKLTKEESKD